MKRSSIVALLAIFGAFWEPLSTKAQVTFISPVNPEIYLKSTTPVTAIACDVISTPKAPVGSSTAYLQAIGYSDGSGVRIELMHSYPATGAAGADSADDPDVVLADDLDQLGTRYHVAFVYTKPITGSSNRRAWISKARLSNITTGTMFVDGRGTVALSPSIGVNPRIDMFAHTGIKVNSTHPSLDSFVVGWGQEDDSLHIAFGSMKGSFSTYMKKYGFRIGDTIRNIDVAGQYLVDSNRMIAHVGFTRDSTGVTYVYHAEINCSVTPPFLYKVELLTSDTFATYPIPQLRIEAPSLYSTATGGVRWSIVTQKRNSASKVQEFNSLGLTGSLFSEAGGNSMSPCIAAGVGPYGDTTKFANKRFVTAWQHESGDTLVSQFIDMYTGDRVYDSTFYIINDTLATQYLDIAAAANSGQQVLVAWYDGADIWYKLDVDNIPGYKPSSIPQRLKLDKAVVYPNPTTLSINVLGGMSKQFFVTDLTGRQLLSGTINGPIDISSLLAGNYIISIHDKQGNIQHAKFVKE